MLQNIQNILNMSTTAECYKYETNKQKDVILVEKPHSFPPEIIENILCYCDHKTITVVKCLNGEWKQIADYVIMKRCCRDISQNELVQYMDKWTENCEVFQWDQLYDNWINWGNIAKNIQLDNTLFLGKELVVNKISTICAFGDCVALGVSSGVMIFDMDGTLKNQYINLKEDEEIVIIHFVHLDFDNQSAKSTTALLIAYPEKVVITDPRNNFKTLQEYQFESSFSVYKQYFACISSNQVLIAKISNKSCQIVHRVQIEAAINEDVDTFLSEGSCIVMVENRIKVITFEEGKNNVKIVDLKPLQFAVNYMNILGRHHTWIFHDNIVIVTYYDSLLFLQTATRSDDHHLELFLLSDPTGFSKAFLSWDIFDEEVNFVHVYGNTLILCFMSGWIYFYEIRDWKLLELAKYAMRLQLPNRLGPIKTVDVIEKHGQRFFYIVDSMAVHKIVGTFL